MKKEQENSLLNGMLQVVELLNLHRDIGNYAAEGAINTKSQRKANKKTQELIYSEVAYSSIMTVINMLAPFLVSLGVNIAETEDKTLHLVYKDDFVDVVEDKLDEFMDEMLEKMRNV